MANIQQKTAATKKWQSYFHGALSKVIIPAGYPGKDEEKKDKVKTQQ